MKILVAVDPSDSKFLPVVRAAEIARKEGAELTLMGVAEVVETAETIIGSDFYGQVEDYVRKALEAAREAAKNAGAEASVVQATGDSPAELVVDEAQRGGYDLVVTGTRGKKGVSRLLLGSVAGKIVTLAPCSVLVVR